LTALGQALKSGNASSARQALATLAKDAAIILQNRAAAQTTAGNAGTVTRLDALITTLDAIPGVTTAGASASSANSTISADAGNGRQQGSSRGINVIA
jgi:hypothetical protein